MTECNAIIEANNEIDRLKRANKKLNNLCVKYGCKVDRLEKENKHLNYRLNDLKHEIHHLKHEQKCLIKDISFLDMSAPQAKQAIKENEQLKQFKEKVFNLINTKIEECEKDYDRAVQAGMPSMIIYDEIESLEWLKKELEE